MPPAESAAPESRTGGRDPIKAPAIRVGAEVIHAPIPEYEEDVMHMAHFDAIHHAIHTLGLPKEAVTRAVLDPSNQGFITRGGRYLSRREAIPHVMAHDQLRNRNRSELAELRAKLQRQWEGGHPDPSLDSFDINYLAKSAPMDKSHTRPQRRKRLAQIFADRQVSKQEEAELAYLKEDQAKEEGHLVTKSLAAALLLGEIAIAKAKPFWEKEDDDPRETKISPKVKRAALKKFGKWSAVAAAWAVRKQKALKKAERSLYPWTVRRKAGPLKPGEDPVAIVRSDVPEDMAKAEASHYEKYDRRTNQKMAEHNREGGEVRKPVRKVEGASSQDKRDRARFAYRKATQALKQGHPLKDENGDPTPAAMQFKRWGFDTPQDRSDLLRLKAFGKRHMKAPDED